jgi:hypothetical protein
MFLDYKSAHAKDAQCTVLLGVYSPTDALHVKYPLSPIEIYATRLEVDIYCYLLGILENTTIREPQAMMEMVKRKYLENLEQLSTDLERMRMDPNFWYEQFTLDSDAVHLNNHMIEMVLKYMKGNATRMETYIDLGAVVHEFKHRKGIFARRDLALVHDSYSSNAC